MIDFDSLALRLSKILVVSQVMSCTTLG